MHSIVRKGAGASPLTIEDMVRVYRELQAVRSPRFPPRRRKLQPYVREALRRAVLLLCLLLALALGGCGAEPEASVAPAPISTPPTVVPPTATQGLTPEERQAVAAIFVQVSKLSDALSQISVLAANADFTNSWKTDVAIQIAHVRQVHQSLLHLDVPPKIGALRAAILNATADCNASVNKLDSGIDMYRAADLDEAGRLMRSCGNKIDEARPELERLSS